MIVNLFSKRQKRKQEPEIFIYDKIPQELRIQVIHIWQDAIGQYIPQSLWGSSRSASNGAWEFIHNQLAREYGRFRLGESSDPYVNCQHFIQEASVERTLDIIELSFFYIDHVIRSTWHVMIRQESGVKMQPDEAIEELNSRFREHAIGYQYLHGQIVRVDSEFIYDSAVKPALILLTEEGFEGASQEFMSAHEHFRHKRYKEAVNDALKSFESAMKTICKRNNWAYKDTDQAKTLIGICLDNGLIPSSMQNHLTAVRTSLESGLPTIRNRRSGHGQGEFPQNLPPHVAAYALHLAATNIVFLVESYKGLK